MGITIYIVSRFTDQIYDVYRGGFNPNHGCETFFADHEKYLHDEKHEDSWWSKSDDFNDNGYYENSKGVACYNYANDIQFKMFRDLAILITKYPNKIIIANEDDLWNVYYNELHKNNNNDDSEDDAFEMENIKLYLTDKNFGNMPSSFDTLLDRLWWYSRPTVNFIKLAKNVPTFGNMNYDEAREYEKNEKVNKNKFSDEKESKFVEQSKSETK